MVKIKQLVKITWYGYYNFEAILLQDGYNIQTLYQSLAPKLNRDQVFQAGGGAGKSGSFFFFSHDGKFLIKTMTSSELKCFRRLLPAYKEHLIGNEDSLIAKIYGIFTVKTKRVDEVHLMLMENTLRV
jgi:1-phosphatidylinositol-4-phosphate 5-kinase